MKPHGLPGTLIPAQSPFTITAYEQSPGNVLVVAPHPDDDVIGAGGMMALLAQSGRAVFSLYVTDGRNSPVVPPAAGKKAVAGIRRREALAALKAVKARGAIFLNYNSQELHDKKCSEAAKAIREALLFLRPETVYVPTPFDRHPTHCAALRLTLTALRSIRGFTPQLFGYNVWGGVYGVRGLKAVDISSVVKLKRKAIRMHCSQIAYKAYDEGILARNRYEAVFAETHGSEQCRYVESFLDMQELVNNKKLGLQRFVQQVLAQYEP
ncbi:MAG: PIG-L family deacetylase [Proteobacteria bacterium]|nr:PIG-L family deacetylase [Pseudomonadota bacterium]